MDLTARLHGVIAANPTKEAIAKLVDCIKDLAAQMRQSKLTSTDILDQLLSTSGLRSST